MLPGAEAASSGLSATQVEVSAAALSHDEIPQRLFPLAIWSYNVSKQNLTPQDDLSLAPAIFALFPGFPRDPPPIDVAEKLERIVEHLDKQHDAVKKNMLTLIKKRVDYLIERAETELPILEEATSSLEKNAQTQQDIRSMIRRAKAAPKTDAAPGTYEVKESTFADSEPDLSVSDNQDLEMSIVEPRTQTSVRAELIHALRDLVMRGATELEDYEAHAEKAAKEYKDALDRRQARSGSTSGLTRVPAVPPPRGILGNKNGEKLVDEESKKMRATFNI